MKEKIEWTQNTIRFYGKESLFPAWRLGTGTPESPTPTPAFTWTPKPWTPELLTIKQAIEPLSGVAFNSVLINYYRDGKDRVAWHSDDEKELGQNPIIGSVSLGAERKFKLRHKQYKTNGLKHEILLRHGSFLLMQGIHPAPLDA